MGCWDALSIYIVAEQFKWDGPFHYISMILRSLDRDAIYRDV